MGISMFNLGTRHSFFWVLFLFSFSICAQAATQPIFSAIVEQSGTVSCSDKSSISCELSCVAWVKDGKGGELIFGNDTPPQEQNEASVFSVTYAGKVFQQSAPNNFFSFPPFSKASKFESMSATPDGNYLVAMTAFNRYIESDAEQDKFNTMIAWAVKSPKKAKTIMPSQRSGIESSMALRNLFTKAIHAKFGYQANYFKIEGLALLPQNRILFGVREIGQSFTAFDYRVVLLEGKYKIVNGEFLMDEQTELTVIRDFSETTIQTVGRKVGLSSIEYDVATKQLYILTTFEDNEQKQIGAFLWVLQDEQGGLGKTISLVKTSDGAPFQFSHKAEGLAVLNPGRVFIIHDDDRYLTNVRFDGRNGSQQRERKPNEAAFDILQICSSQEKVANCLIKH
jgi:hypothetical protein